MSANTSDWKEAKSGDVIKLAEGERVEGTFQALEESSLYPDSYALKLNVNGENKTLFVSGIVASLLDSNNVQKGQEIAVLFAGMKSNSKGTRKYKDFKVFFK